MIFSRKAGFAILITALGVKASLIPIEALAARSNDFDNGRLQYRGVEDPSFGYRDNMHLSARSPEPWDVNEMNEALESLYRRDAQLYGREAELVDRRAQVRAREARTEEIFKRAIPTADDILKVIRASGRGKSGKCAFWSGMKDTDAEAIARKMGLNTLEMYVKPHAPYQPLIKGGSGFKDSQVFWENASKAYSKFCTGKVTFLVTPDRAAKLKKGDKSSVWAHTEGPGLFSKMKAAVGRVKDTVMGAFGKKQARAAPAPSGSPPSGTPAATGAGDAVTKVVKVLIGPGGKPGPEIPMDNPNARRAAPPPGGGAPPPGPGADDAVTKVVKVLIGPGGKPGPEIPMDNPNARR